MRNPMFNVVDLFSGAGGMSYGFHAHDAFRLRAAADAEIGKPSMGPGSLQCNATYAANMGFDPVQVNLSGVKPSALRETLGLAAGLPIHVLSVCPPCTGFSRANPNNHLQDDHRNSLVAKAARFATALDVEVVVMENARELLRGNFSGHFGNFETHLKKNGYRVFGENHFLTRFGLPQIRERALVVAAKKNYSLRAITDLWRGWEVAPEHTTVAAAFRVLTDDFPNADDVPSIAKAEVRKRLAAIPRDGGSWSDLLKNPKTRKLLTPAMERLVAKNRLGSHPDVYGRMAWNKPAPTIKRECAHIGNGRYAHPEKDRLCTVREMAILQGFPTHFVFSGTSLSNKYRHIGDAVPPLVSYQIAHLCHWILTGEKPVVDDILLEGCHLEPTQIQPAQHQQELFPV